MQHIRRKPLFLVRGMNRLGLVSFFMGLGFALFSTIWALYLDSFVHDDSVVGFITTFFTIVGVLAYFYVVPLVEKNSKSKLFVISLIFYIISFLLFTFLKNAYLVLLIGVFMYFFASLRVTTFGIIVRDNTKKSSCLSKNEGIIYTFFNFAFMIGPLIAGFVAARYGLNYVFLPAALFIFIALQLFSYFKLKDDRISKRKDKKILKVFKQFFKNRNRVVAYLLSAAVTVWWSLIYVYMPLYIVDSGLDDLIVGYLLFAVTIPLILLEFPFSKTAGRVGFKKMFSLAFLLLVIICVFAFIFSNIYVVMGLMVLASVALAMLEPTTEAYFFDIISENQRDKYYGPYTTAIDFGHLIGTGLPAVVLLFLPFKFIFLLYGLVMFIFFLFCAKIKNVIEAKLR